MLKAAPKAPLISGGYWGLLVAKSSFPYRFFDLSVFKVRYSSETKCDNVGKFRPSHQENSLEDLLLGESISTERLNVARSDFGCLAVELRAEIQEGLIRDRNLGMYVVDRNLLRLRTFELQHAYQFAMCGYTVSAEIRSRTHKEDVFLLAPWQCAFFDDEIAGHGYFSFDHVRTRSLFDKEIGQKAQLFAYGGKRREVLFFIRLAMQIAHNPQPPLRWPQVYTRRSLVFQDPGWSGESGLYTGNRPSMSHFGATSDNLRAQYPNLVAAYGFLPNLFLAQSVLPHAVEAEQQLIEAVLVRQGRLSREEKDAILHSVATVRGSDYCRMLFGQGLPAIPDRNSLLIDFSLKLARYGPRISGPDVVTLQNSGFDESAILETIVTTGVGLMLCTLADGLQPALDAGLGSLAHSKFLNVSEPPDWPQDSGPHLGIPPDLAADSPAYTVLREQFGFVPNLYRLQSMVPGLLDTEVRLLESVLFSEGGLNRVQKECVLLAISAANLNTYCATLHSQVLSIMGVPLEESDRIVANQSEDQSDGGISAMDRVLLDESRKLATLPGRSSQPFESERLRVQGFTESQVIEAVVVAGLANLLNTLQAGVGAVPDFPPRSVFGPKDLYPFSGDSRPISNVTPSEDPDAALVARVQKGEIDVFEELVRRHSRRVFGVLAGLVGNMDDVSDATQEVFLKAFEKIGSFQGRSKFSTWLTSIAINTGTELLRQRKPSESLEGMEDEEGFRPRQIQRWEDNPEQLCSSSQINGLVRAAVLRLPEKYRVAVLLRDINQLSTEEAAAALELSIPALKARVLRGRLMLRESLAPHFIRQEKADV